MIGHNQYRLIVWDNKEEKEIHLSGRHIAQELLRPTPSSIFEIDAQNKNRQQATTWDFWYQLCTKYKEEFGHSSPEVREKYQGYILGWWCLQQRMAYRNGELSEEQIRKLEELSFVFDINFQRWNQRFSEYKEFVRETGILFPNRTTIYNEKQVGTWVFTQRGLKKKERLNPVYEKLLLEFNPEFFKDLR